MGDIGDVELKYRSHAPTNAKGKKKSKPKKVPLAMLFPKDENEEQGDILEDFYRSRLPKPDIFENFDESYPALNTEQKEALKLTADELIERAFTGLKSDTKTKYLLLRCQDILSLQSGGNPKTSFEGKLQRLGTVAELNCFPRQCALVVTYATDKECERAKVFLHNTLHQCHKMHCCYLKESPTREVIRSFRSRKIETAKPLPYEAVVQGGLAALSMSSTQKPTLESSTAEADEYLDSLLGDL